MLKEVVCIVTIVVRDGWLVWLYVLAGCNRLGAILAHAEQNETSHSKYYIIQRRCFDCRGYTATSKVYQIKPKVYQFEKGIYLWESTFSEIKQDTQLRSEKQQKFMIFDISFAGKDIDDGILVFPSTYSKVH